jgi:L-rhamnonate dehydratase
MIDCLCRWDVPYTLEFAERALDAELRLAFIEEPLLPDDLAGYERLCREVQGTRIASGEHEYTRHGFRILLRHSAAHILQPDVTWSGGLTEGRAIASLAAEEGVPVYPHRGGSLFGIHLVLGHANCTLAESFGTGERGNETMQLLSPPFADGYYLAPVKPGIGAEFDPPLLRRLAPSLA